MRGIAREELSLQDIRQAYQNAAGLWTGCDWPTQFGKTGLNLQGWTSSQASDMASETVEAGAAEDWFSAAVWLSQVEHHAREAQAKAAAATGAAEAGDWTKALQLAEAAWALEFSTGRALRRGFPLTWQRLRESIDAAHQTAGTRVRVFQETATARQ